MHRDSQGLGENPRDSMGGADIGVGKVWAERKPPCADPEPVNSVFPVLGV